MSISIQLETDANDHYIITYKTIYFKLVHAISNLGHLWKGSEHEIFIGLHYELITICTKQLSAIITIRNWPIKLSDKRMHINKDK